MDRFKIDINESGIFRVALYIRRRSLFGWKWEKLWSEDSIDAAKAYYNEIKDLPEYLP